jgi:hypothetical protein
MSVANDALLLNLGLNGFPIVDDMVAATAAASTATRLLGQVNRFIKVSAANNLCALPSLLSLEAPTLIFVINDDPANGLKVQPFGTETIQGVNAASAAIAAGTSMIFVAVVAAKTAKGGGITPGSFNNDWRNAAIP